MTFIAYPKEKQDPKAPNKAETPTESKSFDESQWGYDLYPDRRQPKNTDTSISDFLKGKGRENLEKIKCERNVYRCIKESPLPQDVLSIFDDIFPVRNVLPTVSGGYDPILNQVVICQNVARKEGIVQGVLTHEMIHMFDYCRNNLDFQNLDHFSLYRDSCCQPRTL
ncbi:hypothetical protein NQ317_017970 [Molorchus minor]|uniref:Mitochondrial inner membrane protease ATP23 n=1 Tax=Molorchus minor TaxID=1323400 RepID=A0ABQ9JN46_9CUCU|nr:hypothetical protein NQ317_017970 [Molorchus minor]